MANHLKIDLHHREASFIPRRYASVCKHLLRRHQPVGRESLEAYKSEEWKLREEETETCKGKATGEEEVPLSFPASSCQGGKSDAASPIQAEEQTM